MSTARHSAPRSIAAHAVLLDAVRSCAPAAWTTWTTATEAHSAAVAAWLDDARQQSGRAPSRVAIVDSAPREQFLYPEFELDADAFREHGVDCVVAKGRSDQYYAMEYHDYIEQALLAHPETDGVFASSDVIALDCAGISLTSG